MNFASFLGGARRGIVEAILGLVLLWTAPATAYGYSLRLADNGESLRWWEASVVLRLDPSVESIVPEGQGSLAVEGAVGAWVGSGLLPLDLEVEAGHVPFASGAATGGNGQNDLYVHSGMWPHDRTWSAVTELTFDDSTGEILEADIVLDGSRQWSVGERIGPASVDLRGIVTHELGHLLGLSESTEPRAVMFQVCDLGEVCRRELSSDDEMALAAAYGTGEPLGRGVGCAVAPSRIEAASRGELLLGIAIAAGLAMIRRRSIHSS